MKRRIILFGKIMLLFLTMQMLAIELCNSFFISLKFAYGTGILLSYLLGIYHHKGVRRIEKSERIQERLLPIKQSILVLSKQIEVPFKRKKLNQ